MLRITAWINGGFASTGAIVKHSFLKERDSCIGKVRQLRVARISKVGLFAPERTRPFRPYATASFVERLERAKSVYVELEKATNTDVIRRVFEHTFKNVLSDFHIENLSLPHSQKWALLQSELNRHYNYSLPAFYEHDLIANTNNLLGIRLRPLFRGGALIERFGASDYLFTPSDFLWSQTLVGCNFTYHSKKTGKNLTPIQYILGQGKDALALPLNPERLSSLDQNVQRYALLRPSHDAVAAMLLATPHIDADTFVHEIGCWNGQNLFHFLFYASLHGKVPKYCLGTNINAVALAMGESVASLLEIDSSLVQFCLANAGGDFEADGLGLEFQKQIVLALRVLPIFDPSQGRAFLQNIRKTVRTQDDIVIVSYAILQGEMYEKNQNRAKEFSQQRVTKTDFSGGTTFRSEATSDMLPSYLQKLKGEGFILNTYYTEEGFSNLVEESGFKVVCMIRVNDHDNERIVALLRGRSS